MECYNIELYHHGIKGQRWGIRRYQNPDGGLTDAGRRRYGITERVKRNDQITLKSGESVQRISSKEKEINSGPTYVSFTELDNLRYLSYAGSDGMEWTANWDDPNDDSVGKKLKIKVTHDIVVPSFNEAIHSFVKNISESDLEKMVSKRTDLSKKEQKRFAEALNNLDIQDVQEQAISEWSRAYIRYPELTEKFFADLEKKGYNAIVDYQDAKEGFADMPLLIFKRQDVLSNSYSVEKISTDDRDRAFEALEKKLKAVANASTNTNEPSFDKKAWTAIKTIISRLSKIG